MSRNGRKVLYSEDRVRAMFAKMRAELAILRELRATVLRRHQAEAELANLRRQRSLTQAWATERDPALPLH